MNESTGLMMSGWIFKGRERNNFTIEGFLIVFEVHSEQWTLNTMSDIVYINHSILSFFFGTWWCFLKKKKKPRKPKTFRCLDLKSQTGLFKCLDESGKKKKEKEKNEPNYYKKSNHDTYAFIFSIEFLIWFSCLLLLYSIHNTSIHHDF